MKLNVLKIRHAMLDENINQTELSKVSGVKWTSLSYIMQGEFFEDLQCICQTLNLKINDVITE